MAVTCIGFSDAVTIQADIRDSAVLQMTLLLQTYSVDFFCGMVLPCTACAAAAVDTFCGCIFLFECNGNAQVVDLTQEAASDLVTKEGGSEEAVHSHAVDAAATEAHGQLQIQHQAEATAASLAQVRQHSAACVEYVLFDH